MSTKEQMLKARELIKAKRYDEARAILRKINHPKAKEWLDKLDAKRPASQSKKQTQAPKTGKLPKTTRKSTRSRSMLPIILGGGVLVTILALVVLFVIFNSRDDGDANTTTDTNITLPTDTDDNGDSQTADTDDDNSDDNDQQDTSDNTSDSDDNQQNTTDNDNDQITTSGVAMRIPFVNFNYLVTIDVPAGWVCDCGGGSGNLETVESPRQRIDVDVIDGANGALLANVLESELDDDETITTQEILNADGRSVLFAIVEAEDGDSDHHYYVTDTQGNVLQFKISDRDEPETLQDTILTIAGTVEAEGGGAATNFTNTLSSNSITYNANTNQWRFADFVSSEYEHTVELPEGWAFEDNFIGVAMAVKDGSMDTSATAFTYLQSFFYDEEDSLTDIAMALNEGSTDELQSDGTETVNGREVYFFTTVSSVNNSETVTYITLDSDGDLILLIIQPQVPDKASLHDDVLFMAGNIEVTETDYISQLIRAGLLEGDVPDDGFAPVSQ